jgi:phosphatidylethanolamine/phosphatidyl-N-methylethanolamine N-methyltransferase
MKQALREHWEFFRQFRQRFQTTGSVLPSSRFLARAMTGPLRGRDGPRRVLEVGPGTGAVTKRIVRELRPGDQFDLVEINEQFAALLGERFQQDDAWQRVATQSRIHCLPLQEFQSSEPYDFIISGLPFANFPSALVKDLLESCLARLAPGGTLSFFEYMYMRPMKRMVVSQADRQRLREIGDILSERFASHRVRRDWVFVNFPPAWVQHLCCDSRQ